MVNIWDLVAVIAAALIISLLLIDDVRVRVSNRKLFAERVQVEMNSIILMTQLEKLSETQDIKRVEETQGFVKFLSESRDWAFTYIEDVQTAISEYKEMCDSEVHDVRYREAYDKLISFLPSDTTSTDS